MREILFRGKRLDNGEWIDGMLFDGEHFAVIADKIMQSDWHPTIDNFLIFGKQVIPETVGQYTGLNDKNAKKIFEHDILKAYDPLDKRYFIGVVKYFDASFYICDTNSVPCYFGEYSFTDFEVEVIGNIYDDPELMKTAS